jgi:tRNA(fMet)-specific endonuclease VapC
LSYLLDTNICIALLKGRDRKVVEKIHSKDPRDVFLSSIVKSELLFGARKSQKVEENLALLLEFFAQFESLPFDDRAAEFCGITRALLERAGTPVGANDLLIAGIAQANDLTVVSRNRREFGKIPGLRWEEW